MCIREQRCLVSLDLDFADPIRFPPSQTAGIVILRTGKRSSMALLQWLTKNLLAALRTKSITGRLWIVELNRIRVHDQTDSDPIPLSDNLS